MTESINFVRLFREKTDFVEWNHFIFRFREKMPSIQPVRKMQDRFLMVQQGILTVCRGFL